VKRLNRLLKHSVWGFAILSIVGSNTHLFSLDGSLASIKDSITTISKEADWNNQLFTLTTLLQQGSTASLDSATQQNLVDLIATVFNKRITYYQAHVKDGTTLDFTNFNAFLDNASQNMMLTEAQRTIINGYESISVQEESLLQNQLEHDYTKQVQVLSIVLRAAGSTTYDAFIQDLAFNQLNAVFNNRASQSNTTVALLNTIFKIATQSSLLNADQKNKLHQCLQRYL